MRTKRTVYYVLIVVTLLALLLGSNLVAAGPALSTVEAAWPVLPPQRQEAQGPLPWNQRSEATSATWHIEVVTWALGGRYTSISLDTADQPHIGYFNGTKVKYARFDGMTWQIETVDDDLGGCGGYTSLYLDLLERPHISYSYCKWPDYALKYARYDGTTWQIETVDDAGEVGFHTSLALDTAGHPHISYFSHQGSGLLKYAYYDGSNWQIETVDSGLGTYGGYTSLALDSNDQPHIGYYHWTNRVPKYAYHDGSAWQIGIVDSTADLGRFPALALDSNDRPHMSYAGQDNASLKYAYHDGTSWQIETIYSGYIADTFLILDAMDQPHVSYYDSANADLMYAHRSSSVWEIETVDSAENVGTESSLDLDTANQPHIAYRDSIRGLKYAWGEYEPDTTPPAAIDDLTATPSIYPGDIILSWTAPGDDGNTGTASLYEIKWDTQPISSESDWTYAFDVDGEPTPLIAGTTQTMTVTKTPGVTLYFAIRARDEVGNWGGISSFPSVKAPGMLISDINEQLEKNPSDILGQQVTVLVMPVRTTDLTLGAGDWGETVPALKSLHEICKVFFTKQGAAELAAHGGIGGLLIAIKAALIHQTLDNWLQMRAQLVWGIHEGDLGDRTLLIWDPAAPLMNHGVPYVVTGTVSKKTFFDVLALKNDYFYHLEVEHSSDQVIQQPSTTHPHFAIPAGYTYRKWEDIQLDGVTGYGDPICTIGLVTERYPVGGHHYVRIQLMERISGALPVRVPTDAKAPDMGAMALYCGTKRAAGGDDLHPGWLPLSTYLDTTTGDGSVQLLQGYKSQIERHECPSRTFLGIEIGSPADIHVYDLEGNHVGVVYDGSNNVIGVENEIPDVEYFYGVDDAPEFMTIGNPTAGTYTVTIRGTATGTYTQTVRIYDSSGGQTFTSTVVAQPTYVGKEDMTVVDEIPVAPTGLEVDVDNSTVKLDWDDNTESDLAGYNVYRSTQANGVYQKMNDSPLSVSSSTDSSADEYTAYYYYVTAEDTDHNESGHLAPVVSRYLIYLPLVSRNH